MEKIIKIKTFDNQIFDSVKQAEKHLIKLESDLLTSLSHKMISVQKYKDAGDFILENLHNFAKLQQIQNDMELIDND